jgi:hypothetical protein
MTTVKDRAAPPPATEPPPAPPKAPEVNVEVKTRTDVGAGVIEVTVQVDDKPAGSSFVLTSPRNFAFRRTG